MYVLLQQGSGKFEITYEDMLLVSGKATIPESPSSMSVGTIPIPSADIELTNDIVYAHLEQQGYIYNGPFRGIENLSIGREGKFEILTCICRYFFTLGITLQHTVYVSILLPIFTTIPLLFTYILGISRIILSFLPDFQSHW